MFDLFFFSLSSLQVFFCEHFRLLYARQESIRMYTHRQRSPRARRQIANLYAATTVLADQSASTVCAAVRRNAKIKFTRRRKKC